MAIAIVRYAGPRFDPLTTENTLAITIVKNIVDSIGYSFNVDNELCNKVELKVR